MTDPIARSVVPPTTFDVALEGMHCASCVGSAEKALHAVAGVDAVAVNLATSSARLQVA